MLSVLRMALPAKHFLGREARTRVTDTLQGCTDEDRHVVERVTAELFANAVEAGSSEVVVEVEAGHNCIRIRVSNVGAPFNPRSPGTPETQRGRGLQIVQAVGTVRVVHDEGTTSVEVDVPLASGRATPHETLGD